MPTIQSVHSPEAMNTLSIRSRGKKWRNLSIEEVMNYASNHKISFQHAYKNLTYKLYNDEEID